jgi:nucleoside-diphosphate-sugar epimerase
VSGEPKRVALPETVLITGAAGNMGRMLARHLAGRAPRLRLMYHRTPLAADVLRTAGVEPVQADLGDPRTIAPAVAGVDVVVHFAGVLFAPRPAQFLPITNVQWFAHLLDAALAAGVRKVVLASFPQVEGPTTVDRPATGRLDREPVSIHARTRLEAERLLMARTERTATTPVVLRLGVVYGEGVLLIEAARRLARHGLLCVWREPTVLQLIAVPDYLRATETAIRRHDVGGIYHVGDEQPVTIQEFLDGLCAVWGYRRPRRVPMWTVRASAALCELFAQCARTRAPLTPDIVTLGRVSHWGDTGRARADLVPDLICPTFSAGLRLFEPASRVASP